MDEGKLLEELRQQRDVIRRHLEWFEQKISLLDQSKETDDQSVTEDASKPHKDSLFVHDDSVAEKAPEEEQRANEELYRYKAPTGNDLHRAKIGCFVLFVLSTTLFLFLLFGLPYLLD